MGRNGASELTQDEVDRILELLRMKKSVAEISKITGRSTTTISKIKKEAGLTKWKDQGKWDFLTQNWHFVIPEKPKPRVVHFRTPYNYRNRVK